MDFEIFDSPIVCTAVEIQTICSVGECNRPFYSKGMCRQHWNRVRTYGRVEKIKGAEKSDCLVSNCINVARVNGYCRDHYVEKIAVGVKNFPGGKIRNHELYGLWSWCCENSCLVDEWAHFETFVKDVSPRPGFDYNLVRLRDEPLGPINFKWKQKIRRGEKESKRDWIERQKENNESGFAIGDAPHIRRTYGLSPDEYNGKLKRQNYVCEICKKPETARYNGILKKLSVDHNHTTGKVRDLLCWRCNTAMGRIGESVEVLQSMVNYLNKHKEL